MTHTRRIFNSTLAGVSLALATAGWTAPARTWFPIQPGNQWTLTAANGDSHIIRTDATPDGDWETTGLFNVPVALRFSAGKLNWQARLAGTRNPWQTVARFGRKENRECRFNLTGSVCDDTSASWVERDVKLVTPAGTFAGCRHWHSDRRQVCPTATAEFAPDRNPVDIWFAPEVGPVGLLTGAGDWYWLTAARIDDQIYATPTNDLLAQLTTDQSSYTNVSDHFYYCPPCTTNVPPCLVPCYATGGTNATAAFTFQITNPTPDPQTFTFPTGQTFDIILSDTNNVVVTRWSMGKAFPTIVTTLVLPPNHSLTYPATLEMVDSAGESLHGPYTARAYLTNTGGPTGVAAKATLQVIYLLVPATTLVQPAAP